MAGFHVFFDKNSEFNHLKISFQTQAQQLAKTNWRNLKHGRLNGGLMVSAFDCGSSSPGSSPGLGHCVVFLGKTLHSHSASFPPGV